MQTQLTVLYRGALETCNYACGYCPFAKRKQTAEKKQQDIAGLANFINWITHHPQIKFTLFFTPWGEALVFKRYQQALASLVLLNNVDKIIIQTNLSSKLDFLKNINTEKLRVWCTYHPSETTLEYFLEKTQELDQYAVTYSVGVVGQPKIFEEIKRIRNRLNPKTYLWINAYVVNNRPYPYTTEQQDFLNYVDPLFSLNKSYDSLDSACITGKKAITIDEFGNIRRCHFIKTILANINQPDWQNKLITTPCTNHYCDCHIGYVFLESFKAKTFFGEHALERIPL